MLSKQKTTNLNIQLPIKIEVDDYHEFTYLEKFFKLLNNNIKVKELSQSDNGKYIGIVYLEDNTTSNTLEYREWGC
tara:strand:- start:81 stop:308 length:228 start_codon:yes stop_codon:yes gene_type:complete